MKSYTDLFQSKKLAEILPLESADMYYALSEDKSTNMISFGKSQGFFDKTQVAWSLAALLGVLPEGTRLLKSTNISSIGDVKYYIECPKGTINKWFDNPVDACVELILKLNELWKEKRQ